MKKGKQIQENTIIEELKPDCYKESFGQKAINSNKIICELNFFLLFLFWLLCFYTHIKNTIVIIYFIIKKLYGIC